MHVLGLEYPFALASVEAQKHLSPGWILQKCRCMPWDGPAAAASSLETMLRMCPCEGYTREDALGKPVFGLFEIPGTSHVSCQSLPYLVPATTSPCALRLLLGRRVLPCLCCDA